MDRKRVLFVIPSLEGAGAQRVVAMLLEHLDRERFQPLLTLFEDRCDYPVPEDVPVTCLNKKSRYSLPRLIWRLARTYKKERPDVVLSFMNYTNLISILARKFSGNKPKLFLSERIHASIGLKSDPDPLSRIKVLATPWLYPHCDGIICVSRGVGDDLVTSFGVPREKIEVIHNPVDIDRILTLAQENIDHPWFARKDRPIIIAMGRLTGQKGYPYLLRAFTKVRLNFPCRVVILGEGEQRGALKALAKELGIVEEVAFLGFQKNPYRYLAQADLFVLSSLFEGFPNTVTEAMACGTPVVATRCPSGPEEIITDGVNGLLVPVADEEALAEAMLRLLHDSEFSTKLAKEGRRRVDDFAVKKIVQAYEAAFSAMDSAP